MLRRRAWASRAARTVEERGWLQPAAGLRIPVGPLGGPFVTVDGRGRVTGPTGRWSVDWWIGADDGWRFPSRAAAARQRELGAGAVIETAMRVPGGDAVQRVWAGPGAAVVEVENASPAPFALAWAVRPFGRTGEPVPIRTIDVTTDMVQVDGRAAIRLPVPARHVAIAGEGDDLVETVTAGAAPAVSTGSGRSRQRLTTAALIVPVAHRTCTRLVVPLLDAAGDVPEPDAVQRGWASILSTGFRVSLPDQQLDDRLASARRRLLVDAGDLLARRTIEEVASRCATVAGDTVTLLPEMPEWWVGQNLDVHDLPYPGGKLSFGVRWHGLRPALLWEATSPARLTVPSLDPAWHTDEASGDALLAPHPTVQAR